MSAKVSIATAIVAPPAAATTTTTMTTTTTTITALMSRAGESHTFRKLKTPSRCRDCDSYVYFQGIECQECGLASHKKCLSTLTIQCGHVKLPRKMTTFGVALTQQSNSAGDVPLIVTKCAQEIERRGANIKGIYRVSGVKSRVEKICQSFESAHELVDLSSTPPNVIANVLKLYLRQLPEPLVPFRLYPKFIHVAKSFPSETHRRHDTSDDEETEIIYELKRTVGRMPKVHYNTLAFLMHHLKRVSENSHENNMPSSNLGIVFGPTLLRTSEGDDSLSSLVDTVHQSRVIELLITYSAEIFDSSDGQLVIENSSIQPKLFKSATCVTISGQKVVTGTTRKETLVEARRKFFTSVCTPPQYRPSSLSTTVSSSPISPLSQSIQSLPTTHPKLWSTISTPSVNELSRSATCNLAFASQRNNNDTRQLKYI